MLPIANKPMLMYGFDQLRASGIKKIGVILGPLQEGIVEALGDGSKFGVRVTYIAQPEPKGIAHAVLISQKFLGDSPFIVHLGDNLLKDNIPELAREFLKSRADASLILTRVRDPERFGVVLLDRGKIAKLVEKPKQYISDLALAGVYFLRPTIFPVIEKLKPSSRNELEITDALQRLLDLGGRITYNEVSGWWKDTGRPEDILEANELVLKDLKTSISGVIEEGATVSGEVTVGEGTVVRNGTTLWGPVVIGDYSEIGNNATVGPNTSLGNHVRILSAKIENSIVLDGAVIDCVDRIVDSIIGKDSRIVSSQATTSGGRQFVVGESTFMSL